MKKILISVLLLAAMVFVTGSGFRDNSDYGAGALMTPPPPIEEDREFRMPGGADFARGANFYGTVEKMSKGSGTWTVDKRPVQVTESTELVQEKGKIAVGAYVWVEGNLKAGVFTATRIEANRYGMTSVSSTAAQQDKLYGVIESIKKGEPSIWTIKGTSIYVTKGTKIVENNGKADVGSYISVTGKTSGDNFTAEKIETLKNPWGSVKK
ncbi:MAG: DUF5666 domain-containing protein [Dissulfurispiraceae bacterium]|jgi:hypothetical protein|nr:DUF5666 domain-containing protein [Dissulfurispiraceae bacterium]